MTPGEHVRARRKQLKLKATDVKAAGGPSIALLSQIENDHWDGTGDRMEATKLALASALRWPPPAYDWLQEGDDPSWWTAEEVEGGVRWTRAQPDRPPMVVTDLNRLGAIVLKAPHHGEITAASAMARAREAQEEVIRLKVRVEAMEERVEALSGLLTAGRAGVLNQVLALAGAKGRGLSDKERAALSLALRQVASEMAIPARGADDPAEPQDGIFHVLDILRRRVEAGPADGPAADEMREAYATELLQVIRELQSEGSELALAAKGERNVASESDTVTKLDEARKKQSPRRQT